jgi:hypothetical protein
MPTLLLLNGFRFFFYSNENAEPAHIHVNKGNCFCKVWLTNIQVAYSFGFNSKELNFIKETVEANATNFQNKWNEYFRK